MKKFGLAGSSGVERKPMLCKRILDLFVFFVLLSFNCSAQTFTNLIDLDKPDGEGPRNSPTQGVDGAFYGTTQSAGRGPHCCGTAFRVTSTGLIEALHLNPSNGDTPEAGLLLATDGKFYGTATGGGVYNSGTVFIVDMSGKVRVLHNFCEQPNCIDGATPYAGLLQGSDGSFYGTTVVGGTQNKGTLFRLTRSGEFKTLYNFCSEANCIDGGAVYSGLIQGTDEAYYGVATEGGSGSGCFDGCGTVFRVTRSGRLTVLHNFGGTDGAEPAAALVQAADGALYGTTALGGDFTCDAPNGCGTLFEITPDGSFEVLHNFELSDGAEPAGPLVQGTDGDLYGTASGWGVGVLYNFGTVFKLMSDSTFQTLHAFDGTDGSSPQGGLLQATNGLFYGTTYGGGDFECDSQSGCGTIFSLDMGLAPFVSFVRCYGRVGQAGAILGQGFTGTTSVSFNGTPASFTVKSDTLLITTVPPGATTGYVQVTTPTGTLTSNKKFVVLP